MQLSLGDRYWLHIFLLVNSNGQITKTSNKFKYPIRNIEDQILLSKQRMNHALDCGDFRKAEVFLDQMTSFKRMLEAAA